MNGTTKRQLSTIDESLDTNGKYSRDTHQQLLLANLVKPKFLRLKLISMGEVEVGKSCLIKRYCEYKFFPKYVSTIGVDFGVKQVVLDGHELRINFWDLSGHPQFFEVRNEFYKDAQGAVLVYDVNSRKTFDALDSWVAEATKYGAKSTVVAVCGNKSDGGNRAVSEKDGKDWAAKNGFMFFETSAQSGQQVNEMFEAILKQILASYFG